MYYYNNVCYHIIMIISIRSCTAIMCFVNQNGLQLINTSTDCTISFKLNENGTYTYNTIGESFEYYVSQLRLQEYINKDNPINKIRFHSFATCIEIKNILICACSISSCNNPSKRKSKTFHHWFYNLNKKYIMSLANND